MQVMKTENFVYLESIAVYLGSSSSRQGSLPVSFWSSTVQKVLSAYPSVPMPVA
jgi:hypothetical protein